MPLVELEGPVDFNQIEIAQPAPVRPKRVRKPRAKAVVDPEKVDIVDQNIKMLLNSYRNIRRSVPSSWFVSNNNGAVALHLNNVCHAPMCYDFGFDDLYTAVWKTDEASLEYLRMLINGPFRAYCDKINLVQVDDLYYLHVSDLGDIPANIVYNFVVASRVPIEHNQLINPWYEKVQEGYHPTLAFLLSYSTNGSKFLAKRTFNGDNNQTNHFFFYSTLDWGRLIKGDFEAKSVSASSYKKDPRACRPTNQIWGITKEFKEKFLSMPDKDISEFFELPIEPPAADPPKPAALPKKKRQYGIYGGLPRNIGFEALDDALVGVLPEVEAELERGRRRFVEAAGVQQRNAVAFMRDNPQNFAPEDRINPHLQVNFVRRVEANNPQLQALVEHFDRPVEDIQPLDQPEPVDWEWDERDLPDDEF